MVILWKKLFRDLKENKMAYIACLIVISIGLMSYAAMSIAMDNLNRAKNEFYKEKHFAEGFAKVKSMPLSKVKTLSRINGIKKIEGRLVKDVRVLLPEREEDNVYLRLVSIDPTDSTVLNGVQKIIGRELEPDQANIWIGPKFFEVNGLELGKEISVVVNGTKTELLVIGTAQSPEFVYPMQNEQSMMPTPEIFDIAYIPYEAMDSLFSAGGNVNDIIFTLQEDYSFKDVEDELKAKLKKYGFEVAFERKDQLSHAMLQQELDSIDSMAKSVPFLFIGISAIILYIMLKRLVEQQRGLIGTLKAFGYTQKEILFHYLSYSWIIGLGGGIIGGLSGTVLSGGMTEMYKEFFQLPNLNNQFSWQYFIMGIILSVLGCLFAGFQGVKGVMKLQPAEGMRPEAPPIGKKILIEEIKILWSNLTVQGRMAMRNIFRSKGRSFFTLIGIIFTFAMMATMISFNDMIDIMMFDQFNNVQTYNVKVSFEAPLHTKDAIRELQNKKGVIELETMLEVPATFKNTYHEKGLVILGINKVSSLYNILDSNGKKVQVPTDGILLSESVAKALHVEVGDKVQIESPWAKEDTIHVYVTGIIPQYLGGNAYMEQDSLGKLLGQGEIASSAILNVNPKDIVTLKEDYNTSNIVQSIEESSTTLDKYMEMMGSYGYMIWVMVLIAVVTGFAIVYNSSIISLAERKRELASLRVLGMTYREVLEIISFEQWVIGIAGMVLGIPMTFLFKQGMADSMNSDLLTMPTYTSPSSFLLALAGTALAIIFAQFNIARNIKKLDLVEVLKERE